MIVGAEMKTLWKLHALILINSPKVTVVRPLALALTDGSVEIVPGDHEIGHEKTSHIRDYFHQFHEFAQLNLPVDDVVLAYFAVSHSHSLARVLTQGDNC